MNDPIVGIDLGTTNTCVALCDDAGNPRVLPDDNGYKIQPSVVSFHPNGSVIVGAEAKQRKIIDPRNTVYSAKRLIGRSFRSREITAAAARMPYQIKEGVNQQPVIVTRAGEFAVPEISAIILDHVRTIARKAIGTDVARAVITVPANFTEAQRSATATAGAIAGLTVVRVLNEPTAAALAYGHAKQLNKVIAVYDFGGGTFDVTLLRLQDQIYEVLGTAGDSFLGGDDIDERLVDHMVAQFLALHRVDLRANEMSIMRLRAVAEQTKIELSRRTRAIVKVDEIAYGPGGAPLHLECEISRDEFVSRVSDIVERTFPVCEEALRVAGLPAADVEDIVLVGGTTKIPHVRDRVTRFFGKTPRTDINPEEAIAVGAGLQAASLHGVLGGRRTARTTVAPPAPPLAQRPPTQPADLPPGRVTAPRVATTSQTTLVDGTEAKVRRTTEPMASQRPPARGERPVQRGEQVDRIDVAPAPAADGGAKPLGRITRQQPATAPPAPTPPPAPPPIPRAPASAKTMMGVPSAPSVAPAPPAPVKDFGSVDLFDDVTTNTQQPRPILNEDLLPELAPAGSPPSPIPSLAASQQPTLMMTGGPAAMPAPPAPVPAPSQAQTMIQPLVPSIARINPAPAPMVIDVTPRSLGIATVAGYCEEIIRRNARVPTETRKMFSTSKDKQQVVRIRVCQGESRRLDDNLILGDLVLEGLEPRPRGETTIEVTFFLDASGMLQVRARDARTGVEQRANIDVLGAQSPQEVDVARNRLREMRR